MHKQNPAQTESCTNRVQKIQWSFCYNSYFILTNKSILRGRNFFQWRLVKTTQDLTANTNGL